MKYNILLVLFTLSLASSLALSLIPASEICDPGVGCSVIHHSIYNETFGIQNSYYGVVIFALLIFLVFFHIKKPEDYKRKIIHAAIIIGSPVALYFIYLQEFILNAYCKYCMVVDLSMLAALFIILFKWKE